jgi:hypothetical protein
MVSLVELLGHLLVGLLDTSILVEKPKRTITVKQQMPPPLAAVL